MFERDVRAQKLCHQLSLGGVGRSAQNQARDPSDLFTAVGPRFATHARGQGSCGIVSELAVQQGERLWSDRRLGSLGAARVGVRSIKDLEKRIAQIAPD